MALLETLVLPSAKWTADEIVQFMTKIRGGSTATDEMPLTTLVLKLKHKAVHKAMSTVCFDSLVDREKATAYAALESLGPRKPRIPILCKELLGATRKKARAADAKSVGKAATRGAGNQQPLLQGRGRGRGRRVSAVRRVQVTGAVGG